MVDELKIVKAIKTGNSVTLALTGIVDHGEFYSVEKNDNTITLKKLRIVEEDTYKKLTSKIDSNSRFVELDKKDVTNNDHSA